jgi:hypothetical protein
MARGRPGTRKFGTQRDSLAKATKTLAARMEHKRAVAKKLKGQSKNESALKFSDGSDIPKFMQVVRQQKIVATLKKRAHAEAVQAKDQKPKTRKLWASQPQLFARAFFNYVQDAKKWEHDNARFIKMKKKQSSKRPLITNYATAYNLPRSTIYKAYDALQLGMAKSAVKTWASAS